MKTETKWALDLDHCEIAFKVRHMMIAHVKGRFKTFDATIYTNGNDFSTATINLWVEVASIDTGNFKRDEHLKTADFFDVDKYKQIVFVAEEGMSLPDASNNSELSGDLTIKGVTNRVTLTVEAGGIVVDPWGNEKAGFTVSGKIKRSEWDLHWNTAVGDSGLMVGDDISILCEIELTKTIVKTDPAAPIPPNSKAMSY